MDIDEITEFVAGLPGVDVLVAGESNGAPPVAWGDSFFFYDPTHDLDADRRFPFSTIVTQNYPGFDESSQLDRPGVFRLNVAVGRKDFAALFGFSPEAYAEHARPNSATSRGAELENAELDRIMPHPLYATQGWASILNPSASNADAVRLMLVAAHRRASRLGRTPGNNASRLDSADSDALLARQNDQER